MSRVPFVITAFVLFLLACAHGGRGPAVAPVVLVERDTTWRGDVRVEGVVHVRKSATLSLAPGTRVLFVPKRYAASGKDEHDAFAGSGMKVEGRILAEGTPEEPVFFTVAGGTVRPASWDRLQFSFSNGSRFRNVVLEGARYAIHAHFSEIAFSGCRFRDNEEGVRLGSSNVRIEDSVFTRNEIRGINFRDGRNEIRRNLVHGNGDGIFLHSKAAGATIRGNAIYGNRGYDLRLGDLHAEDVDVSGNWWGVGREEDALARVYDGRSLSGIGSARLSPVLSRPPAAGASIHGVMVSAREPVAAGEVRAFLSVAEGVWGEGDVARAQTDADGRFRLEVPPGRYFVVGRAGRGEKALFAFPGKNPVTVGWGERIEIGLPAVPVPPSAAPRAAAAARPSIAVRVTQSGRPAPGVAVQAFPAGAPDFRGPGTASATTDERGEATLRLPPGKYHLSARRRVGRQSAGMVEEGGSYGVYPWSPVDLPPATSVAVEIPVFEKKALFGGEGEVSPRAAQASFEGIATLAGRPAEGYVVFFYPRGESVGRPLARSSVVTASGAFDVSLPDTGEYQAWLRKAVPGTPAGTAEERIGPVPAHAADGRLLPPSLAFP